MLKFCIFRQMICSLLSSTGKENSITFETGAQCKWPQRLQLLSLGCRLSNVYVTCEWSYMIDVQRSCSLPCPGKCRHLLPASSAYLKSVFSSFYLFLPDSVAHVYNCKFLIWLPQAMSNKQVPLSKVCQTSSDSLNELSGWNRCSWLCLSCHDPR